MSKRKTANKAKPKAKTSAKHSRLARKNSASVSKTQACLALLSKSGGATIKEMQQAIGWQPHSVRGLLSGTIRKMSGVELTSSKNADGVRHYHVKLH